MDPRSISFKGAIQTLEAFQPVIALQGERDSAFRSHLYQQVLMPSPAIESPIDPTVMNLG
jgi:hypothetical protein